MVQERNIQYLVDQQCTSRMSDRSSKLVMSSHLLLRKMLQSQRILPVVFHWSTHSLMQQRQLLRTTMSLHMSQVRSKALRLRKDMQRSQLSTSLLISIQKKLRTRRSSDISIRFQHRVSSSSSERVMKSSAATSFAMHRSTVGKSLQYLVRHQSFRSL